MTANKGMLIKGKPQLDKKALEEFQSGGADEKHYSKADMIKQEENLMPKNAEKSEQNFQVLLASAGEKRVTKNLRLKGSFVDWMLMQSMQNSLDAGRKVTEAEVYEAAIELYRAKVEGRIEIKEL
jgi:hypothetical protein